MIDYFVAARWFPHHVQHAEFYYFRMRIPEDYSPWVYAPKVLAALLAVDERPWWRPPSIAWMRRTDDDR